MGRRVVTASEKVLVIRFGSLGDVVLATAVLEALARERPVPEVHFVTKAEYAPLFDGDERVARVIPYEGALVRLFQAMRRERYGRVLDLHATPRSRLVALLARSRDRRTVDKRGRERRALLGGGRAPSPRLEGGVVAWYGEALGSPPPEPRLSITAGLPAAEAILRERGLDAGYVAVAPGARRRTKAWPPRHVAAFLRTASREDTARGPGLLLVGGADETSLLSALSGETGVPFAVPPLSALPALLSRASAVVTNDSAPLHIAEAVGTPVVSLFGPTVAAFGFAPRGARSIRIEVDLDCRPCTLHGGDACPLGHHRCLEEIEPARVAAALSRVVAPLESAISAAGGSHGRA